MKSIIYKSFLPKQVTPKSEETSISPPSGIYRPQYNWKDPETSQPEATTSQQENVQPTVQTNSPTWTNPSGTIIISDTNDPIYKATSRGQHQFKSSDIQVGEMQELLDSFADAGISLRITSGYRPGATTSSGNQSWHTSGYALDVTPIAGQTYENLKQQLRNNPELVKWMQDNGFGIIDETTPEMQSRTGATGAHWHIGKDKLAQAGLQAILSAHHGGKILKGQLGTTVPPMISDPPTFPKGTTLTSITIPGVGTFNKATLTRNGQTRNLGYFGTATNPWYDDWNQSRLDTGRYNDQISRTDILQQSLNRNTAQVGIGKNSSLLQRQYLTGAAAVYDTRNHTITANSTALEPNSTVILHEAAHASRALPQEQKVQEILDSADQSKWRTDNSLDKSSDYWDSSEEVYARLMEARKRYNLNPNHIYTKSEIRALKRKAPYNDNLLNRYDIDTLTRLFNEVASLDTNKLPILNNQPDNSPVLYARSGRKLQDKVTSRLYEMADREHKQKHPLTARTDKPLEPVSIASILPGTGDVAEGASIVDNVLNKNIIQALISAGLLVLPGNVSKVSKTLGFKFNPIPIDDYVFINTSTGTASLKLDKLTVDKDIQNIPSNLAKRYNTGGAERIGLPNLSKEIQSTEPLTGTWENMLDLRNAAQPSIRYPKQNNIPEFIFLSDNKSKLAEVGDNKLNVTITPEQRRQLLDHEISHYIDSHYRPDFYNSKLDFVNGSDYQRKATEVGARVGQLKDAAGITDGSKTFTEQELKNLFDEYLNNPKNIDNGISKLKNSIKDWSKFTNWVNQNVPLINRSFNHPLYINDNEDDSED